MLTMERSLASPVARPARIPGRLAEFAAAALDRALADRALCGRALGEVLSEPKPGTWFERGTARLGKSGVALDRRTGPSSLIFARQPLVAVRTAPGQDNLSARGAYVLAEAEGGARRATLFATGSEVALAVQARDLLVG